MVASHTLGMDSESSAKNFIINHSAGIINSPAQAMIVIVIIFILGMMFSGFLLYRTFSEPEVDYNIYDPTTDVGVNN